MDSQKWNEYKNELQESSYLSTLSVPRRTSLHLNMVGFPLSAEEPCGLKFIQDKAGYFFTGPLQEKRLFNVRFYTLTEIISKGCTLDCRDFLGKWYEAEVMTVCEENP